MPHIEIDGREASLEQLREAAVSGYGHFTAMQVRSRRVRGLALHVIRLDAANREMFGTGLDGERVRAYIRHALGDTTDASVRVHVRETQTGPSVMVTVRPPGGMPGSPWRLQSVPYQRPVAHIKHLGDFGQSYFRRLAERNGFDEALLTGPDMAISEGGITNIGFFDGTGIVWPSAPALQGITMQVLQHQLPDHGLPSRHLPVRLPDVPSYAAAFVTNSRGIAAVGQIDDLAVPPDPDLMKVVGLAYESAPWDAI